jgi:hypothetical protein
MFVISLFVAKDVPRIPLALYALGVIPIALRASVPELALDLGLVLLAASIAWLSGWLWTRAARISAFLHEVGEQREHILRDEPVFLEGWVRFHLETDRKEVEDFWRVLGSSCTFCLRRRSEWPVMMARSSTIRGIHHVAARAGRTRFHLLNN